MESSFVVVTMILHENGHAWVTEVIKQVEVVKVDIQGTRAYRAKVLEDHAVLALTSCIGRVLGT